MRNVLVGTCGFAEAQDKIFRDFSILEVQRTFYQPPKLATAEAWRRKAPDGFVFTLKAWQLLTHAASSPTYRHLREPLSRSQRSHVGGFRWNAVTHMAWERTQEIAAALQAEAIVFQTPKSFLPEEDNLRRLYEFFEAIDRDGRRMVFEPRGPAWEKSLVRHLVQDLDLVHAVDPFLRQPVGRGLRYFRLHGCPVYHYHYQYTDEELCSLARLLTGAWPHRVLFNNDAMANDARRFRALIAQGEGHGTTDQPQTK